MADEKIQRQKFVLNDNFWEISVVESTNIYLNRLIYKVTTISGKINTKGKAVVRTKFSKDDANTTVHSSIKRKQKLGYLPIELSGASIDINEVRCDMKDAASKIKKNLPLGTIAEVIVTVITQDDFLQEKA